LAIIAPGPARAASTWTVYADHPDFLPSQVTIGVGDTVLWHNNDSFSHTVVSDSGAWTTLTLSGAGSEGSVTFTTAGIYDYHCSIHPTMTGTVIVSGAIPEFPSVALVVAGLVAGMVAISVLQRRRQP